MSNILKKITKKYKWLRFLNYKTTKLAVLSAALFGLCLSSGASFAKYRDENYGNGNAGIARIGDIEINDIDSVIKSPTSFTNLSTQIHSFIFGFSITYENFEVAASCGVNLRISPYENTDFDYVASNFNNLYTSFYLSDSNYITNPSSYKLWTFTDEGKQTEFHFNSEIGKALAINKFYIGTSSDGTNYSWVDKDYNIAETNEKLKGVINVDTNEIVPQVKTKIYYKVLVFVTPDANYIDGQVTDVVLHNVKILYYFAINQITKGG